MLNFLLFTNDPAVRDTIEKFISGQDISLLTASTYQEAATLLENTLIALVVVDFNLSQIKGKSLLEHTQDLYPDIRLITLSPSPLEQIELPANGFTPYVGTSYVTRTFHQIVESEIRNLSQGGTITNVSTHLFAQLLEMEKRTCVLRLFEKITKHGGLLVFRSGKLVDARFNTLSAMDAACRILAWEEADIFIQNVETSGKDRIDADLQSIIMKSAYLKDEGLDSPAAATTPMAEPPAATPPATTTPTAPTREISFPEKLRRHLKTDMGDRQGFNDIIHDSDIDGLISDSQAMGSIFDLGRLKLGYADDGTSPRIIFPGSPPTVLTLNPQCPRDRVTQSINRFLDQL